MHNDLDTAIGARNGVLLGLVFWAAIIALIFWL
jgi:hypothetical protein